MIRTLLFDADGVIQTTSDSFYSEIKSHVPLDQAEEFIQQVFAAERPALTGKADFRENLQLLLEQWQVVKSVDEVLATWHRINIVPSVLAMLKGFRDEGYKVCLATNQQANRMRYMRHELGLDDHFDHAFYSCELGAAKPSAEYFSSIMEQLDTVPLEVLFIDDSADNIASATRCGIHTEHFCVDGRRDPVADLSNALRKHLPDGACS